MTSRATTRVHVAILAAIVAAAALLRTWAIGREALWADEALSFVLARWPVGEMLVQPIDPTPFLYYWLHQVFIGPDAGAGAARAISLACGLLAIPLIYAAGRLCFGPRAGLAAAALLAAWGPHIDYSQEARAYALLVLLTLASATSLLWWFAETQREEQRRAGRIPLRHVAIAAFALTTALSFYSHIISILWIALALQILVSLSQRKAKRYTREMLAALAAMALLALPGLVRLVREIRAPDAFHWLPQASAGEFVATVADIYLPVGPDWLQAGTAAALLLLLFLKRSRLRRVFAANPAAPAVVFALLALPLLLWLAGFAIRPIFMPRTALYAAPGAILLIAGALELLDGRRRFAAATAAAVALVLAPPLLAGTVREKEDWNGAFAFLESNVRPGDLVIACPAWKYPALRHASANAVPAPVVVPFSGNVMLLERSLGGQAGWDRTFFEAVTVPLARPLNGGPEREPYSRGEIEVAPSAAIWLVASECSDSDARSLVQWIGGGEARWNRLWSAPSAGDHAAIEIGRHVPAAPIRRTILLAR